MMIIIPAIVIVITVAVIIYNDYSAIEENKFMSRWTNSSKQVFNKCSKL